MVCGYGLRDGMFLFTKVIRIIPVLLTITAERAVGVNPCRELEVDQEVRFSFRNVHLDGFPIIWVNRRHTGGPRTVPYFGIVDLAGFQKDIYYIV